MFNDYPHTQMSRVIRHSLAVTHFSRNILAPMLAKILMTHHSYPRYLVFNRNFTLKIWFCTCFITPVIKKFITKGEKIKGLYILYIICSLPWFLEIWWCPAHLLSLKLPQTKGHLIQNNKCHTSCTSAGSSPLNPWHTLYVNKQNKPTSYNLTTFASGG